MQTITASLTISAMFSDDGKKRYLLQKTWDAGKPSLAIIMLVPTDAAGITMDTSTMLVQNNALRLGYGGVSILNLFATLNDFSLKQAENEDTENREVIVAVAEKADAVVYAPGVGKANQKIFQERQRQVLTALRPFEGKLHCLCGKDGKARLQHPLSPAVRTWHLSPFRIGELLQTQEESKTQTEGKEKDEGTKKKGGEPNMSRSVSYAPIRHDDIPSLQRNTGKIAPCSIYGAGCAWEHRKTEVCVFQMDDMVAWYCYFAARMSVKFVFLQFTQGGHLSFFTQVISFLHLVHL